MPRNFLIVYAAREGSTAIVARLSRNPHVRVPVAEELDRYWIRKFYGKLDLPAEFSAIFETGTCKLPHRYGAKNYLAEPDKNVPRANCAVGFKWRPNGVTRTVLECFRRHEVLVFHLVRRDFVELVASLYISTHEVGGKRIGHAQFAAARSEAERARLRGELDALNVQAAFLPVMKVALRRVGRAMLQRLFLARARATGLTVRVICYEDFNDDPEAFHARLCADLGVPVAVSEAQRPRRDLKKVARRPAKDRVGGLDRGPVRVAIAMSARLYERLVGV